MRLDCACRHPLDEHDPSAARYCEATTRDRLTRRCICVPVQPEPLDRQTGRGRGRPQP
jgi:hypothetical protein